MPRWANPSLVAGKALKQKKAGVDLFTEIGKVRDIAQGPEFLSLLLSSSLLLFMLHSAPLTVLVTTKCINDFFFEHPTSKLILTWVVDTSPLGLKFRSKLPPKSSHVLHLLQNLSPES
jgi:hypothetical protein